MSTLGLETGLQICSFIQNGVENSKLQYPVVTQHILTKQYYDVVF
jgi:hypothetical protein